MELLAKDGAEITCLIRGNNAGARLHRAGARIRKLDMSNAPAVSNALEETDLVFHLAYDWGSNEWNFKALRALIDGCLRHGCKRLVHVSSFVVYDIPDVGEVSEGTPASPATEGYSHTKLALEAELLKAVRERGLAGTIIQPTVVYGPYSKPWTIDPADMLRFGTVVLPDGGEGVCNAVFVDDVVHAMILAALRPEAVGQRYLVSGEPITWKQFYEGMARVVGAKGPEYWPAGGIEQANTKAGKIKRLVANPGIAIRRLAGIGPIHKVVGKGLRVLPHGARRGVYDRLYAPASRQRGHVHVPNSGHLRFLQGRAAIHSAKARAELGYAPAFGFEDGMEATGRYLRDVYLKAD